MPKLVELPDGRVIEFPDGMSDKQIDVNLRLSLAGEQGTAQATEGAVKRSEEALANPPMSPWAESAMAGMSGEGGAFADPNATGADILKRGAGMATTASTVGLGMGLGTAPAATIKSGILGTAGATGLGEGGKWVGEHLPFGLGGPMAGTALQTLGGLVGGISGGMVGPKVPLREILSRFSTGGAKGLLSSVLGGGEAAAAKGAATQVAKTVAPEVAVAADAIEMEAARGLAAKLREAESAAKIATRQAESAAKIKAIETTAAARAEAIRNGVRVPKAGPKAVPAPPKAPPTEGATALKPEDEFIPDEAVSLVAEPLPFRPRGSVKPATNLGGKAKPGPAPTPDDKLAETLQASIDAAKAKSGAVRGKGTPLLEEALDTASGMHQREATAGMTEAVAARRREVGSQKVARELGMGRHEVQSDAGTILNEALGEVSPVIPEKAWAGIVAKMKSLPPEERVAYVARARGVKNMAQIENLRRTLETLGLLLPIGVASQSE